ncbi:MAG TPA: DNA methylase [Cyanobacteria bacterium UBA11149]|nr:DNA methylase [Cyanobacteria bacterium UBA11367]HBE58982.1 DNA methylase [Cyanobacteria bacterium UBA11366]HBK63024.1 DNA methylase [Cyanobacteria bacterium UBA11166]HBR76763.1 DNA methylase [Cyanobacteria bacterium UBA11159]HBS70375.1 DNA methylase [Cyanobacteria bacterium UBA11153]HBW89208.1 DNA methylase [Cyanobacteria bacterium UBA11149]HCA97151.1 DNA methylase [Cyanobacteria bacterium UBA9226]
MQLTLFDLDRKTIEDISHPSTYKGIYSFHKYWGKKPTESIIYFIQKYTSESDIVLDPFLGSGFIGRECLSRNRRFIGIDLNPLAIEHSNFLLTLPKASIFKAALKQIEQKVKRKINESYLVGNSKIASHYLWQGDNLLKVWLKPEIGRNRIELEPTSFDLEKIKQFSSYLVRNIRKPTFFTNSRINSNNQMSLYDLFTPRALSNIDLLLDEINLFPENIQRALLLTLTSASGQMSSMVFAITNRGKTKNQISNKVEVGSWVIGYWRPELHFEINVWNCFESRAKKLYKSLFELDEREYQKYDSIDILLGKKNGSSIINGDCLDVMTKIPDKSIKLICTDPPHSDRIPYLELSEMWNSILNKSVIFEKEVIVSNAKERNKKIHEYIEKMKSFINESSRIIADDGILLIYFNARNKQSWKFLEIVKISNKLQFIGAFPMEYSANSVVQDNRKNGMKTDYVLVLKKAGYIINVKHELEQIPGWLVSIPEMALVS